MEAKKFRKKPVVIEAMQFDGENGQSIVSWLGEPGGTKIAPGKPNQLMIPTLEGLMFASVGDWIIKGVAGEFYPCKPDIFEETYELADDV